MNPFSLSLSNWSLIIRLIIISHCYWIGNLTMSCNSLLLWSIAKHSDTYCLFSVSELYYQCVAASCNIGVNWWRVTHYGWVSVNGFRKFMQLSLHKQPQPVLVCPAQCTGASQLCKIYQYPPSPSQPYMLTCWPPSRILFTVYFSD